MTHADYLAELSRTVRLARSLETAVELGALYADFVGYDLHADDPSLTTDDLRDCVLDMVREHCYQSGIHASAVGLTS